MQLALMNIFYSMWQLKDVVFSESLSLLWGFFNRHIVVFFEISALKEVRILRYLHSNSAVLMLSSKLKLSYTILLHTWKTFVDRFFIIKLVLCSLFFECATLFFINEIFFKKKRKTSLKACFCIILQNFLK